MTKILPQEGFTFDDLLLVPRYSAVLPRSLGQPSKQAHTRHYALFT